MRSFGVIGLDEGIEIGLHFLDTVIEFLASLHAEVLVQEGSMEAFDKAV